MSVTSLLTGVVSTDGRRQRGVHATLHAAPVVALTVLFTRATLCYRDIRCVPVFVCLSVCLSVTKSQVGVLSKRLNGSSSCFGISTYLTFAKGNLGISKIRLFPSGTLSHPLDFKHFATTRRLSQVLSTQVDAQCDRLMMVLGRQFITLSFHLCVQHYERAGLRQLAFVDVD